MNQIKEKMRRQNIDFSECWWMKYKAAIITARICHSIVNPFHLHLNRNEVEY